MLFLFLLINFTIVDAFEITYSEWSDIKPEVEEYLIDREDRYLFYRENEINVEYLKDEDINNKQVDYSDFKYTDESELLDVKPEEKEGRIISEVTVDGYYNNDEIKKVKIVLDKGVYISEIYARDKKNNNIEYNIDERYSVLNDFNEEIYIFVKELVFTFNENQNLGNLYITIYYESDNENDLMIFKYLTNDDKEMFTCNFDLKQKPYQVNNLLLSKVSHKMTKYKYKDKLYKTYEIEKEVTEEYYVTLDGYKKIEDSKKTFYRYITNDYLVIDGYNNIVEDPERYCVKSFCTIVYLTKPNVPEQEETVEEEPPKETPKIPSNPKTLDNIYYYMMALLMSFTILIVLNRKNLRKIFLVLSNRFK